MPPRKSPKKQTFASSDSSTRPLVKQLKNLDADQLNAIIQAALASNTQGHEKSTPSSPTKRKMGASQETSSVPSTPSPKKKKAVPTSSVDSPVIRALENLSAGGGEVVLSPTGRPMRTRTLTAKAQAAEDAKPTKYAVSQARSTLTRVYPDVKVEADTSTSRSPVAGLRSVISLSDDDELPEVSNIYRSMVKRLPIALSDKEDVCEIKEFIDQEAVEDKDDDGSIGDLEYPDDNTIDKEMVDFIVPDDADVVDEHLDDEYLAHAASLIDQEEFEPSANIAGLDGLEDDMEENEE
ncbi:hypothetical protein C0995_013939 [Termitomyces sp. Mi166|nr:hypothetical protein C0995_013939 [Termitomyces sp. Mi166\